MTKKIFLIVFAVFMTALVLLFSGCRKKGEAVELVGDAVSDDVIRAVPLIANGGAANKFMFFNVGHPDAGVNPTIQNLKERAAYCIIKSSAPSTNGRFNLNFVRNDNSWDADSDTYQNIETTGWDFEGSGPVYYVFDFKRMHNYDRIDRAIWVMFEIESDKLGDYTVYITPSKIARPADAANAEYVNSEGRWSVFGFATQTLELTETPSL